MYYNKDMLEKEGIKKKNEKWDEMKEEEEKIKEIGGEN